MQLNWPEGIDEAIFLRDYWQQKPLYIPNAFVGFESPLDQNDLAGLSMDEDIPSRIVWEEKDGRQWTLERGPFDEEKLASMPTSGWSLLVSDIEKHLPEFVEYFAALNFLPSWRIDDLMISTAPDGGSVGPHIDEYDVFLFQAEGQRHWSLAPTPDNGFGMIEDADLKIIDQWQAEESMLCSPGDLLYLPPGYGHHGVARGDGCVTWSFGFRAPNAAELINGF
ncbi:MAG: cupin domain-containing protein, partial [Gammaproteobacteria bacterium]|nr:cupin domain-containing protein [Gammaproteobacteria bacterium]